MMLPGFPGEPSTESANPLPTEAQTPEQRLEQILSCVAGAGEVRVLLSVTQGEETAYQTDTDIGATDQRSDTVTVTDRDRNQTGLVVRVDPPVYLGAVVVCQGADDPQVRLAIVEAVSKYTGLRANQISVLKMK
jgi:stage III sporulation protein AG